MASFATFLDSGVVANTSAYSQSRYIILSHPYTSIAVAMAEFDANGLVSTLGGFVGSDGNRSLTGYVRLSGGNYLPKNRWEVKNCIVNKLQLDIFNELIAVQSANLVPITLSDYYTQYQYIPGATTNPTWLGTPTTLPNGRQSGFTAWNVWVDVDRNYVQNAGIWFSLSFQAEQI